MKKIFFLLSILILTGCQNPEQKESKLHNNTTTIEKFDLKYTIKPTKDLMNINYLMVILYIQWFF